MGDLSPHFDSTEFACHDDCGFDTPKCRLVVALEELRGDIHRPLKINSGCRCVAHNRAIDGHHNSFHLTGSAADVRAPGLSLLALFNRAICVEAFFEGGIGVYPPWKDVDGKWRGNFLHLEIRDEPKHKRFAEYQGHKLPFAEALEILKTIEKLKASTTVLIGG